MSELKRSAIWRQWAYFVECPYCQYLEELGEDLHPDEENETTCSKCEKKFIETWDEPWGGL